MGAGSLWHWLLLILVVVLLFGRGKISEIMGDFAKGIKSFKKGMADDEPIAGDKASGKTIDHEAANTPSSTGQTKTG